MDYKDTIAEVEEALAYAGFNAVRMRKKITEEFERTEVIKILVIYIMTGNSVAKKVSEKKVVNIEVAKELVQFLKDKKVYGKKKTLDSYTLSRFAICFPVLVAKLKLGMKPATPKVETTSPSHLQDLCFNSFISEPMVNQAEDFIMKFSFVLAKAQDATATETACREKIAQFRKIGADGHSVDVVGKAAFTLPLGSCSIDDILTAYGFEEDLPSSKGPLPPRSKADKIKVFNDLSEEGQWKVLGLVRLAPGTANKKKLEEDMFAKARLEWESNLA